MTNLRRARRDDLAFILTLEQRCAGLGFLGTDDEELHAERMDCPDTAYLVIMHGGQPSGFAILCGLTSVNRSIEVKRVAVSQPGQGIGREALRQIMSKSFVDLAAHRLWLDVYTDNERARRTYRALGFVEEGTMRDCIWQGGKFRSLVLMSMLESEYWASGEAPS